MIRLLSVRAAAACTASVLAVGVLGACSDSEKKVASDAPKADVTWPAPSDPLELAREAGLEPEASETLTYHVHSHLDVFVDGESVLVPAGIGINIDDPAVKRFEDGGAVTYGGIRPPCDQPCISPLHTHAPFGIVHTESATATPNKLGQFFIEWDVKLDENCVDTYCAPDDEIAVYVDGEKYTGDPREIELTDRKEIAIVIGTPPDTIPDSADFTQE